MATMADRLPKVVKITHGRGRCVINIPRVWARELGLDKAECAFITKKPGKKLEVKVYEGSWDYKRYV